MIEIYLQNKLDRYDLFKNFKAGLHAFIKNGVAELSLANDRLIIKVDEEFEFDETVKPVLTQALKKHVLETKEEIWLLDIIQTIFFYDDYEEQVQVLAMAKSILLGERQDLPNVTKVLNTEKIIYDSFMEFLKRDSKFCYDSFLTFRLKDYLDKLIDCVEMAIDEFHLEQEYQNLVESFRFYIKKRTPKLDSVHIIVDEQFLFFDDCFLPITEDKLEHLLDKDIIFEQGLPIKEMVISPLVSIAPKEIYVYCDEIDNGVVQSIQNIFDEKVKLYSRDRFHHNRMKLT